MAQPVGAGAGADPATPNVEYKIVWGPKDPFYTVDVEPPPAGVRDVYDNYQFRDRRVSSLTERVNRELAQGWRPVGKPIVYPLTEENKYPEYLPHPRTAEVIAGLNTPDERINAVYRATIVPTDYNARRSGTVLGQALVIDRLGQSRAIGVVMEKKNVPAEVESMVRGFADMAKRSGGRRTRRGRRRQK